MASAGSIECAICKTAIAVTFIRVSSPDEPVELRVLDQSVVVDHMRTCKGSPHKALAKRPAVKAAIPAAELAGRVNLLLDNRAFVAEGGSRACTMCGVTGAECLDSLGKLDPRDKHPQPACCAACGVGNTHPSPGEAVGLCGAWAAENVGPIR